MNQLMLVQRQPRQGLRGERHRYGGRGGAIAIGFCRIRNLWHRRRLRWREHRCERVRSRAQGRANLDCCAGPREGTVAVTAEDRRLRA